MMKGKPSWHGMHLYFIFNMKCAYRVTGEKHKSMRTGRSFNISITLVKPAEDPETNKRINECN